MIRIQIRIIVKSRIRMHQVKGWIRIRIKVKGDDLNELYLEIYIASVSQFFMFCMYIGYCILRLERADKVVSFHPIV